MGSRIGYFAKRTVMLVATLVIATYITILIANAGGLIDEIIISQLRYDITSNLARMPGWGQLPEAEKTAMIEERLESAIRAKGLDRPFIERTFLYLRDALTLSLGRALFLTSASGSKQVSVIILERLPQTVLLFTTGTILYSILGLFIGLQMARRPGGVFDKVASFFAVVTQVIPPWFFGILFLLSFAFYIRIFPFGGMVSVPAPRDPFQKFLDILYHMALPLFTWIFSLVGSWAYVTRNLVVQIAEDDYVIAAKAKGLPESLIMRRYILRPALPPIITSVALAVISSWQGAIITETVFNWPGLGSLFYAAIATLDAPIIIGLTVVYAYLLVATVLILEILYGVMDPRIRTGG
ncbi:ABC transporter permease [Candidatus Bathyarchaeota archaeon]|nr:ABC transporter permease [Candidatus Bathyarchaeota archaeon]MBS7627432.1 ABC transporter permease [Candidatus Bathyarchaeota archaeon]